MAKDRNEDHDEEDAKALGCTARFEVRWVGKMSDSEKQNVVEWLQHQADQLFAEGNQYAAIYTAQLNPED